MYEELMASVVDGENAAKALKAVLRNKGAPGIDGMTTERLRDHGREHWDAIRDKLLAGTYVPSPVKRVEIPKPNGGTRLLGIPTVLDRWIQQMLLQVLQTIFDPSFHDRSYGFRPGRSAHDAVAAAQEYIRSGKDWVVDMDITKFLDAASYYTLVHAVGANSVGWLSSTLIKRPFCRPRLTWRAGSSPRLTRCITVCRDTPRRRMASGIGT